MNIKITINGKRYKIEEARELYRELKKIFHGEVEYKFGGGIESWKPEPPFVVTSGYASVTDSTSTSIPINNLNGDQHDS